MANYSIVVKDKNGDTLGEFINWTRLQFSDKLNNYGECSFAVPVTSNELLTLTALRRYEVYIYRNNSIVWAGEQVARNGTLQANSPNMLTILCRTFFEMFNSRYQRDFVRFDQIDEGIILKTLVDNSQAETDGNFGFTFGDYETGVLRDREYSNQNIMEAFINMSNLINGLDFYITHDKEINIVPFKGVDQSKQTILEWKTNMHEIGVVEDFSSPANEVFVLGAGFGSAQAVGTQSNLEAKAEAVVRKYKQPLLSLKISQMPNTTPGFGTISLGDTIRVRINEGIYNINNRFRVYGYDVKIGEDNEEFISYLVGSI